jgi:hypothetical protein
VKDELQAFLESLCPSVIMFISQMPKESIKISSILIKEEEIELLMKVKEETMKLLSKWKEETKKLQSKGKEVLQIVKEETLKLPKINNRQYESIIAYIDKIYKESFNKFIYFCWIAKSVVLLVQKNAKPRSQHKFPRARAQQIIKYIPTTYITITYENLDWVDFTNIFDIINTKVLTHEYGLHKFPKLTHFLFSWSEHRKDKRVPLVDPDRIPQSFWRLGPRKLGTS